MHKAISPPHPAIIGPLSKAIRFALAVHCEIETPSCPYGGHVRGNGPCAQEYGSTPVFGPFVPMTYAECRDKIAA